MQPPTAIVVYPDLKSEASALIPPEGDVVEGKLTVPVDGLRRL